ncbi:MAG: alpha/beta hydrolase [Promethearchaeota archaeon]
MIQETINIQNRQETLHGILYCPESTTESLNFPLIIHVNGMPGSSPDEDLGRFAESFVERNLAFFSYDHQGVRESTGIFNYFAAQANIEVVIDRLVHHPAIDPTRIALLGESFGGAMAICHAARDSRITCLGVRSPVYDTELIPTYPFFDDLLKIWTRNKQMRFPSGNHLKEVYITQTRHYNPSKIASLITQPIYIIAGERDELLGAQGFEDLHEKLASSEKSLRMFKKANHNFSYEADFQQMREEFLQFFEKCLVLHNL